MSIDPPHHVPRSGRGRFLTAAGRLLRLPIPFADMRVADLVIWPVAVLIAVGVAIPILVVTTVAAYGLFSVLKAAGVPEGTAGIVIPVLGFGGGLAAVAVVLLRISRRLPTAIRSLVYEDETESSPIRPTAGDPRADPATLVERLAAADATLAVGQPLSGGYESPTFPPRDGPSPPPADDPLSGARERP